MRRAERVVLALGALGESGKTATGTQRADAITAPGEDLVRIGLMADVPDDSVIRGVEYIMKCGGQFDHAKTSAEMAAGYRHRVDGFKPQLVGELAQLLGLQLAQQIRSRRSVEERSLARI